MFERLAKLIKGFFSMFVSGLEMANPKALLEAEVNALQEAVVNYNVNLAKQAALVERLKTQVQRQKKELEQLTAKAKVLFQAKQMEEAGRLALRIKALQEEVAANEQQQNQADDLYMNLTKQRDVYVREATRRIESVKQKMTKAEIAESQAKLAEIATTTGFDLAGSGATLQRLDENLDQRVAAATGKARVASDSAKAGDWAMKAEEEKAMEAQALAEFATAMGLEPPAGLAPKAAPTRALGPQETQRDLGPTQTV